MSTRGTLAYIDNFKKDHNNFNIHLYDETLDNTVHLEICYGKGILLCNVPLGKRGNFAIKELTNMLEIVENCMDFFKAIEERGGNE